MALVEQDFWKMADEFKTFKSEFVTFRNDMTDKVNRILENIVGNDMGNIGFAKRLQHVESKIEEIERLDIERMAIRKSDNKRFNLTIVVVGILITIANFLITNIEFKSKQSDTHFHSLDSLNHK